MLNRDFREFLQSLNDSGVRYLVVGGYAVAFHGHPRYTKDLDVWIEMTSENAGRVVAALERFGFASLGLKPEDFLDANQVVQLGYPPCRIDLLSGLEGVDFEASYRNKVRATIDKVAVDFIGLDDLRLNKRATGRPQDLVDAENLE